VNAQCNLMVDSGAWSAYTKSETVDIYKYMEYLTEHKDVIDHYISLDVIKDPQTSMRNYLLMKSHGFNPIPVYHVETDAKYLRWYLKQTDYIAIGAIAKMSTKARVNNLDGIWGKYLTDSKGMPLAKFHGLGLTSLDILTRYPWFSVDSTSWCLYGKYGMVLVPKMVKNKYDYGEMMWKIFISNESPKAKIKGRHFKTLTKSQQTEILKYVHEKGFKLGKVNIEGKVLERGVSNDAYIRDQINTLFFIDVLRQIPEWPWPFKKGNMIGLY